MWLLSVYLLIFHIAKVMVYISFVSSFALSNLSLFSFTMSKNMPMNSRFLYLLYPGKKN
ncbi:uncharacterized protein RHIMIDRAFT_13003 [Rhizopus microsporus ATCC 52813]|uniref:Uncharacterized protein n=1 Tax=Rhizopus microsporus ATCC 52813 TaxID=1340429 RepID=A0A2G4TA31_RHIZD|nr:uncharacterized protein RHIMIDRAFT_13003 [Rhizopus microsporus ATCC 52813]PHZ17858.1 hypothetical protein RHIMIDRAFT_13003 [Rhizopus microsporus ATCC 52813]